MNNRLGVSINAGHVCHFCGPCHAGQGRVLGVNILYVGFANGVGRRPRVVGGWGVL